MKKICCLNILILAVAILFASCSKEDDHSEVSSPSETGFFYGENGTSALTKADEAQANGQHKTIIAKKNNSTVVEIVLTDLKAGTYPLTAKYAFTYVKNGNHWESTAGTLTITKNDGNKLSGTFKATAGAGVSGVSTVEGKFNDIPVK
ncbi:MAG: DUF6252 family protein [Bacteroidales bacterium]|nr:DUF6252 family protein [Bacteroidales bacterium]